MKKRLLPFCFLLSLLSTYAQTDTEFWFAVPENARDGNEKFCISSYERPAMVTISMPADPTFQPLRVQLDAFDYAERSVESLRDRIQTTATGGVQQKGILIQSTQPVAVYYAMPNNDSEVYTLKGRNALGTEFVVPMQYERRAGSPARIEVVAAEDVIVSFTPGSECVGYPQGVESHVTLKRGETFPIVAESGSAGAQPRNTRIRSTGLIAVNTSEPMLASHSASDMAGDQLVPTDLMGSQYVAYGTMGTVIDKENKEQSVEKLYIFPLDDELTIYVNGEEKVSGLDVGDEWAMDLGTEQSYFLSSTPDAADTDGKKFIVYQLIGQWGTNGAELSGTVLPSLSCSGSTDISYNPSFGSSADGVVYVRKEYVEGMEVENQPNAMRHDFFLPVYEGADWYYWTGTLTKRNQDKTVHIRNTMGGVFHLGVFENSGASASYGYFSNYNVIPLNARGARAYCFEGDSVRLQMDNGGQLSWLEWTGPHGFTSSEAEPLITDATLDHAGRYAVWGVHRDGCDVDTSYTWLSVFPDPASRTQELLVCGEEPVATLQAAGYPPYAWSYGEGAGNECTVPLTEPLTVCTIGNYVPGVNMVEDGTWEAGLCSAEGMPWSTRFTDGILTDSIYVFRVDCKSGTDPASFHFSINGTAIDPTLDPSGRTPADGWTRYYCQWKADAAEVELGIENTSGGELCIDQVAFEPVFLFTDTFRITLTDRLMPTVDVPSECICNEEQRLSCPETYDAYRWTLAGSEEVLSTEAYLDIRHPGDYRLTVQSGQCEGSTDVHIKYDAEQVFARRWDDILGIRNADYNGGYEFTSYQWYRNGQPIEGATSSYIYKEEDLQPGDVYAVLLTREGSGQAVFTCDYVVTTAAAPATESLRTVYRPGEAARNPLDEAACIKIWNISGTLEATLQVEGGGSFTLPDKSGLYLLSVDDGTGVPRIHKIYIKD